MVGKSLQKYRLERAYREVSLSLVEVETNIKMFNDLIRKKIPTNDIRHFTLKQAAQCRVYQQPNHKLEMVAMKMKRKDALAHAKRLRQSKKKTKYLLLGETAELNKTKKKIHDINANAREYKKELQLEKRDKVQFLEGKKIIEDSSLKSLRNCHPRARDIIKDLDVFRHQIPQEPPVGPMICHPDIELSENERLVLNKGPGFMIRRDVDINEFRQEVEKGIAKQNYNDVEQEDLEPGSVVSEQSEISDSAKTMELESKMIFNFRANDLSLERMRCTDFKYNKRIFLPQPKNANREALHQTRREEMLRVFKKVAVKSQTERDWKQAGNNRSDTKKEKKKRELSTDKKNKVDDQIDSEIQKRLNRILRDNGAKAGKSEEIKRSKPAVLERKKLTYSCKNLSDREEDGLKKLSCRIKEGDVVVATSDKSNRFVVMKKSQYIESGLKHTKDDAVVDQDTVVRVQNILNAHTR